MNKIMAFLSVLFLSLALVGCSAGTGPAETTFQSDNETLNPSSATNPSASPEQNVELLISAAASLTVPLTEIEAHYETAHPTVKVTINFASSGTLQMQIENGAPADVFISAAPKQMDALESQDLIVPASRMDLLKNEIVMIVPISSSLTLSSFEDAATDAVSIIAVGDVSSVPAGQYAQETFTFLGIWELILEKTVFGTDVKQVLSWVDTGEVDCGIVYKTDAVTDSNVKIVAEAPTDSHKAIVYPIALVNSSSNHEAASAFITYLQSDAAMSVLEASGFIAY